MEDTSQKQILVAEDDPATAMMLQFNLQKAGYSVTTVADGEEAWRESQIQRFDLIITDFRMPVMDGGELCRRLRATSDYALTPMILISGKGPGLDLPGLRDRLGLAATFAKPIRPSALARVVESELRRAEEDVAAAT
jgi:CheY-like chemotaxis protein